MIILQHDFHLIVTSEIIGSRRLSHHASLALKASLLSGRNLIAYPIPIGGKVAETLQGTLKSILINFDSVSFFRKYSPWNNFRLCLISLLSCTTARTLRPQIQRSRYFGVSMTFKNHIHDFSPNKWSLSSIILPKFVLRTTILVRQQSAILCYICPTASFIFVRYNSIYLQNAVSIHYFTYSTFFPLKCKCTVKAKE